MEFTFLVVSVENTTLAQHRNSTPPNLISPTPDNQTDYVTQTAILNSTFSSMQSSHTTTGEIILTSSSEGTGRSQCCLLSSILSLPTSHYLLPSP